MGVDHAHLAAVMSPEARYVALTTRSVTTW